MSQPRIGTNKDVKKLIKVAESQRWIVQMTGGTHIRFVPPDKDHPKVVYSLTSSDHRSFQNLKSNLRRSGLKLDH